MGNIISAIILGVIEGITEFLPISSTGHLILVGQLVKFQNVSADFTNMFNVVIQLGAILSVVVYFRNKLSPFGGGKSNAEKKEAIEIWKKTIVGVLPALVIGAALGDFVEEKLFNPITVSLALVIGGLLLIWIENGKRREKVSAAWQMSYQTVIFIGLIQCLAMIPGTSRSAATIIGALLLGLSRVAAAEFSFFLAIPTMCAASGYALLKSGINMSPAEMGIVAVGFVVSFFVALGVIAAFMQFISKRNFLPFAYYRIALGALVLIISYI